MLENMEYSELLGVFTCLNFFIVGNGELRSEEKIGSKSEAKVQQSIVVSGNYANSRILAAL